jgi:hypothetical protein
LTDRVDATVQVNANKLIGRSEDKSKAFEPVALNAYEGIL